MKLALAGPVRQGWAPIGPASGLIGPAIVLPMTYPVAETRDIAAPAQTVWELVSDLPRMGEFSPENDGGSWVKGATGPAPGAIFSGTNKNGFRRWKTTATVVECEPGKVFEIAISLGPAAIANWRYEFKDIEGGCQVTESWADHRKRWMRTLGRPVGVHDGAHAKGEMAATLASLAQAVEGPGSIDGSGS
jgi:hypothetical protein